MNTKKVKQLIHKYFKGETTLEEEQHLQAYFSQDEIVDELKSYAAQFRYNEERTVEPSGVFNPLAKIDFDESKTASSSREISLVEEKKYQMDREKEKERNTSRSVFNGPLRIAAGFLLLIVGFAVGRLWDTAKNPSIRGTEHNPKVQLMKTALMGSEYDEQPSAGERLAAVNISTSIPIDEQKIGDQISNILIYTMNNDDNVNVRIAAAEGLFRFQRKMRIQRAFVNALSRQDDPLMQFTLINMLVKLKAKEAIPEMRQLLVHSGTQPVVRKRLKIGIAELRT